jgi:hypothetical protein
VKSFSLHVTGVLNKHAEIFRSAYSMSYYNICLVTVSLFDWNYMSNMPKPRSMNKDDDDDDDDNDDNNTVKPA